MVALEPGGRRARAVIHIAAAWQAMGSALLYARLEPPAEARLHLELLPESFRPPDGNVFALFFVAEAAAIGGHARAGPALLRTASALSRASA